MNEIYEKQNSLQTWSESDSFTIERYEQFSKFLLKSNFKILDIGCNTGRGAAKLKEINSSFEITGIDVVKQRLNSSDIFEEVIYGSLLDLDVKYDNTFDYIVAGEVVEHILPEDVDLFLTKIYTLLKKGGTALLTTPNPHSLFVLLGNKKVFEDPSHFSVMSANILKDKVSKVGFNSIKIQGSGKASRYITPAFPFLFPFGSYLLIAKK